MPIAPFRQIVAGLACLLLAACLLTPGKFVSALDVHKDGTFTYSYAGEIHLLALSKLAQMGRGGAGVFTARPCTDDKTGEPRKCRESEVAQQKQEWDSEQAASSERRSRESDQMKAMLGGIDPSSPKAAEELAARLRRQAGWRRVDYKGEGLFDVDFQQSGTLDRDFAFPTIERFPMANAFITIARRNDGSLRIDAPGFGGSAGGEPWRAMIGGMSSSDSKDPAFAGLPLPDGTFTLTTDAQVLANNTEEGPQADPKGQRLQWTVSPRSTSAPMVLLKLGGR
ncbi:MAG: hypothetical protein KGL44_12120 [Sphingomonadales bacterium]|nr:hypothetical protein [Sphingomonadales bacterium]